MFAELMNDGRVTPERARAMVNRFVRDRRWLPKDDTPAWQSFIDRRDDLITETRSEKEVQHDKWVALTAKYGRPRQKEGGSSELVKSGNGDASSTDTGTGVIPRLKVAEHIYDISDLQELPDHRDRPVAIKVVARGQNGHAERPAVETLQ